MSDLPEIQHEESGSKGRWFMPLDGEQAEMTYTRSGESTIIIDHTGVPNSHRGKGYGEALVEAGVAHARKQGWKVIPLCPFAKAQIMQHPEMQDVL